MRRLFTFLCCLCFFLTAVIAQTNKNWMAGLPDSMLVRKVSIPGTHDSGTAGVRFPMRHYARTQTMNLSEQWDAGIRFFDLRPKLEGDKLKIYHGPANCHLTLEEALLILKGKLEDHPTEFCIIMTNSAGGGQKTVDMTMEQIRKTIPAHMLAAFKPDMTVADIRGCILFIHRNEPSVGTEAAGCVTRGWPGNGMFQGTQMVSSRMETATLWAQDYFTSGNNDGEAYLDVKWRMMEHLLRMFAQTDEIVWCINHASGYTGTGVSTNIKKNSRNTNVRLLEWLNGNKFPVGIIPMDFPHQELVDAIIECNK